MTAREREALTARAEKVRRELAAAEAAVGTLRAKLAKAEAELAGDPVPESGLDLLWKAAPPMARTRSSRYKCRVAWNRIPRGERPPVRVLLDALRVWSRCPEWTKDDGAFVPALDRWLRERKWEDLPEVAARFERWTRPDPAAPKKPEPPPPAETMTPEEIRAMFAGWDTNQPFKPTTPPCP